MARVTVEDCIVKVPNRFDLVVLAAQRAKQIAAGAPLTRERDNDKNPVVALREIADATISLEDLEETIVRGMQKVVPLDEEEEDELTDLFAEEQSWTGDQKVLFQGGEMSEEGDLDDEGEAEDLDEDLEDSDEETEEEIK